jgi:hypothetical protein
METAEIDVKTADVLIFVLTALRASEIKASSESRSTFRKELISALPFPTTDSLGRSPSRGVQERAEGDLRMRVGLRNALRVI